MLVYRFSADTSMSLMASMKVHIQHHHADGGKVLIDKLERVRPVDELDSTCLTALMRTTRPSTCKTTMTRTAMLKASQ